MGGAESFKTQALLSLAAIAVLAILLLSERLRQKIQFFVSRHFERPQHDCRTVWLRFTHAMSGVLDPNTLCSAAAKSMSETFNILSVTIWRIDQRKEALVSPGYLIWKTIRGIDCRYFTKRREQHSRYFAPKRNAAGIAPIQWAGTKSVPWTRPTIAGFDLVRGSNCSGLRHAMEILRKKLR